MSRNKTTALLVLTVALILMLSGSALANLAGSTFEGNDGNLVVNTAGSTDWQNVAGLNTGIDNLTGKTDNSFGQGTKEDVPAVTVVTGSIPPNKNDLTRFYEASEQGANGHMYLYLAWERLVNIGNANLDFEINQKKTAAFTSSATGPITLIRTPGDLLVTYDFGGSGTPTLGLNTWLASATDPVVPGFTTNACLSSNTFPCWGDHIDLAGNAEGQVNSGTIAEPIAGGTLGAGLFGEAAIDLTAANVFPPGVCEAFGSAFVKSRSSSSFTAEIKDFIAPIPVNISNCSSITITKTDDAGAALAGAEFTAYGPAPSTSAAGSCTTGADGKCSILKILPGTYDVKETKTPAGYETAPDQLGVVVGPGTEVKLTFVDPRLFKVLVIVCKQVDNSLYKSTLSDGANTWLTHFNATDSSPCGIVSDAWITDKKAGTYSGSLEIPVK